MGGINWARTLLGGFVAGLVINISESFLNGYLLNAEMEAEMVRLNLPPVGGGAIAVFMVLGFIIGGAMIWLYAAIRPRYGPGPKTAACAATVVWVLSYLYGTVMFAAIGLFNTRLLVIGLVWGFVELVIAAEIGARLYKE